MSRAARFSAMLCLGAGAMLCGALTSSNVFYAAQGEALNAFVAGWVGTATIVCLIIMAGLLGRALDGDA